MSAPAGSASTAAPAAASTAKKRGKKIATPSAASSSTSEQQLARVLKKLETRKLVQHVKSVASKNKKMYLLVGLEPARDITGGSFYSGVEFDHELIRVLAQSGLAYIQRKEKATAANLYVSDTSQV